MLSIFFQGWDQIFRTAIATVSTYIVLVILLRIAGQRTLAKWYAFDLIVTVALGSTFANGVLSRDITVAQAAIGFVILILLQFSVARLVVAWSALRTIVNPPPALVFLQGEFQAKPMRWQRVAEADVRAAVRRNGFSSLEEIAAVVLEADGTFSVIEKMAHNPSALSDIPELGGSTRANKAK